MNTTNQGHEEFFALAELFRFWRVCNFSRRTRQRKVFAIAVFFAVFSLFFAVFEFVF
jgi:hypothetical protein